MSAPQGDPSIFAMRQSAEEHWRDRVRAAKLRFDLAVAQVAQAMREPAPAVIEKAMALEVEAREEYTRELQVFTDMIVRGKMPKRD